MVPPRFAAPLPTRDRMDRHPVGERNGCLDPALLLAGAHAAGLLLLRGVDAEQMNRLTPNLDSVAVDDAGFAGKLGGRRVGDQGQRHGTRTCDADHGNNGGPGYPGQGTA